MNNDKIDFYEDSIFQSALNLATAPKVNAGDYLRLLYYVYGYRRFRKRNGDYGV